VAECAALIAQDAEQTAVFNHLKRNSIMKTKSLILAGLISMIGAAAYAQTAPVAQVHQDNVQIHQDNKDILQDTHQVKHDNAVISVKQVQVASGKQQLQAERGQRNALARAEQADVKKGDIAGAQQLDQARRGEQQAIKAQKQAIRHDQKVIAHRSVDKHEAVLARHEEKVERHGDVAKRDHDSAKI
jgi:hypothetical protein